MVLETVFPYIKEVTLNLIKNWGTEIVAVLVGGGIIWFMGLFPPKYQLQKRLNFAVKISEVVGKMEISIKQQNLQTAKEIKEQIKGFIDKTKVADVVLNELSFSFKSNDTGVSYELSSSKDEEVGQNFVNIKCFNIFKVGFFGRVKKLCESVNEINHLVESFNFKTDKDLLSVHINIVPRGKFLKKGLTKT